MKTTSKIIMGAAVITALGVGGLATLHSMFPHYKMSSGAMQPSLATDSILWVREGAYANIAAATRGDIVIIERADEQTGQPVDHVTRIVGLPGDKIVMSGTMIKINGRALAHKEVSQTPPLTIYDETNGAATYRVQYGDGPDPGAPFSGVVPPNQVFCLGDNRDNSNDSRYAGSVPFEKVIGKEVGALQQPAR